jgi:hypothetical protein
MPVEVRITGAEQLRALGKDLRAMGEEGKGFRKELLASMRVVGKPLVEATRASARAVLPKKGGLNEFIATSNIAARNSLAGNRVGTRIVAKKPGGKKGHDLEAFDNGFFRHPVFGTDAQIAALTAKQAITHARGGHGRAWAWVGQSVTPGWFTKPMNAAMPLVQAELMKAMAVTAAKITKT